MASYWLKRTKTAPPEGPYEVQTLRAMVASRDVTADSLFSTDRINWALPSHIPGSAAHSPAAKASPPSPPSPLAPPAPIPPPALMPSPGSFALAPLPNHAAPPVMLGYSTAGLVPGRLGKRRNPQWCAMVACLALVTNLFAVVLWVLLFGPSMEHRGTEYFVAIPRTPLTIGAFLVLFGLTMAMGLTLGIYWLVWVYRSHDELYHFTAGQYPVSPGQALGFCFIPLFNLYWIVYMPWKMAEQLEFPLGSRRISPARVLALQIVSVFFLVFTLYLFTGLVALLTCLTMTHLQDNLNDLWRRQSKSPNPVSPDPTADALNAITVE